MAVDLDPRLAVIATRFAKVKRILAVTGGKGGIGKSLVASLLALKLSREGKRVGLLDLDFTGPCDHMFLGMQSNLPHEDGGIDPTYQNGIHFMSLTYFIGEDPAPLRGEDMSNALIELLAITRWRELDVLVIDMPPGIGDATLDLIRFLRAAEFVVVSTGSVVVRETVRRTLRFLLRAGVRVAGVLENMQRDDQGAVRALAVDNGLPYLGALPFDEGLEEALGATSALAETAAYRALPQI